MKTCVVCGAEMPELAPSQDSWCRLCRHLAHQGLPPRYLEAKKSDFSGKRAKLFDSQDSLFIYGKVGTGKTWLAAALMREQAILSRRSMGNRGTFMYSDDALFISLPELAIKIRASMDRSSPTSEEKLISMYSKAKALFFDDIGAEQTSDYIRSVLFVLIERRNTMWGGRTVITSNLNLNELAKEHGVRIASRIQEMCRVIQMTGEDRRRR
jgi:DNA replication protein DnaC